MCGPVVRMAHKAGVSKVVALSLALALLPGMKCFLSTGDVAQTFNEGIIDSSGGDPFREHARVVRENIALRVGDELIDGYFGMGVCQARVPGVRHDVAGWLRAAAADPVCFCELVADYAAEEYGGVRVDCGRRSGASCITPSDARDTKRLHILGAVERWAAEAPALEAARPAAERSTAACVDPALTVPSRSACSARDQRDVGGLTHFVDFLRFRNAVERAVRETAALLVEGFADSQGIRDGARDAFERAARYLDGRRWARRLDRRTTGIVSKGGAATGIFSAGATWTVLNLIHRQRLEHEAACRADPGRCVATRDQPRFDLVSGTSTGAFIAAAVDRFLTGDPSPEYRAEIIHRLFEWFSCFALNDMYCAHDDNVLSLINNGSEPPLLGMLSFDGLGAILEAHYAPGDLHNSSELILNTVDFRSGRLFSLSDQQDMRTTRHVRQAVIASAVLPFIADPIEDLPLPVGFDHPSPDEIDQGAIIPRWSYLDGGIRSELPVMPLVKRGVERVLVVSSASSVIGEASRLRSGIEIATRYIDVSTGGVTETEIAHAQRRVESVRLAEAIDCRRAVSFSESGKPGSLPSVCRREDHCEADALCSANFDDVCTATVGNPAQHGHGTGGGNKMRAPSDQLDDVWAIRGVFRDEQLIVPVHGYDFNPRDQRRLFIAGADAARRQCLAIADMLGIAVDTLAQRRKVTSWCSSPLPEAPCACYQRSDDAPHGMRTCDQGLSPLAQSPPRGKWWQGACR